MHDDDLSVSTDYTENSGLFSLGKRKNWAYSKKLFPESEMLEAVLLKILRAVAE